MNAHRIQMEKVQARAMNSQGLQSALDNSHFCRIGIPKTERKSSRASTITALAADKRDNGMYKLACKDSVLKNFHFRSYLEPLPDVTMDLMGLQDVYEDYMSRPEISIGERQKRKRLQ